MGFFDEVGKTLSDASQGALKKGKDLAGIAKYSSMITEEEKKIDELYYQMESVSSLAEEVNLLIDNMLETLQTCIIDRENNLVETIREND